MSASSARRSGASRWGSRLRRRSATDAKPPRREQDVVGMQVEMHQLLTASQGGSQPLGCRDAVEPLVQVGERPAMAAHPPWPAGEVGEHRRAVDAFHHQVPATRVVHRGHGIPVTARELHRGGLVRCIAPLSLAVAAQHPARARGEDVRGSALRDQLAGHLFLRSIPGAQVATRRALEHRRSSRALEPTRPGVRRPVRDRRN
jgi:hypothetical protein